MIPRIFHRIYLDEPVPAKFDEFWARFQFMHPDWDFVTWSDSSVLDWLRCKSTFDMVETHAGRADVLRYEILYRYGGFYVDTDVEPLRSFEPLVNTDKAVIGWENEHLLCPTVIGAPMRHPALDLLLTDLPVYARKHVGAWPNMQTGPNFLTPRWRKRDDVERLDRTAFYPVGWWEKKLLGGPYPSASYCVHHWNAGWLPGGPPQKS